MRQTFYILTIIFLLTSCKGGKRLIEKINFKMKYKFSSEIKDKIAKDAAP